MSRRPTGSKSTQATSSKNTKKPLKTVKLGRRGSDNGTEPPLKKHRVSFTVRRPRDRPSKRTRSRPPLFVHYSCRTLLFSTSPRIILLCRRAPKVRLVCDRHSRSLRRNAPWWMSKERAKHRAHRWRSRTDILFHHNDSSIPQCSSALMSYYCASKTSRREHHSRA